MTMSAAILPCCLVSVNAASFTHVTAKHKQLGKIRTNRFKNPRLQQAIVSQSPRVQTVHLEQSIELKAGFYQARF